MRVGRIYYKMDGPDRSIGHTIATSISSPQQQHASPPVHYSGRFHVVPLYGQSAGCHLPSSRGKPIAIPETNHRPRVQPLRNHFHPRTQSHRPQTQHRHLHHRLRNPLCGPSNHRRRSLASPALHQARRSPSRYSDHQGRGNPCLSPREHSISADSAQRPHPCESAPGI